MVWGWGVVYFTFVDDVEGVQYGYNVFSGKGLHKSCVVYSNCSYSKVNDCLHVAYSTVNKNYCSAHQHPYFSHIVHSLNYRVFTQLGYLRRAFNLLMRTGNKFQGVRKYT